MKQYLVVLALMALLSPASAQKAALGVQDLRVTNLYKYGIQIRCSYDRITWHTRYLNYRYGIDITLPKETRFFYVEICQKLTPESPKKCETYKLAPNNRFVITLGKSNELEIRHAD